MSNVARLPRPQNEPATKPQHRMGPADVLSTSPASVRVRFADGEEHDARVALAFTYEPVVGDSVLAIADHEGCYVIGVLAAMGKASINFAGDLRVQAGGKLSLAGLDGVEIEGRRLDVRVGKLEMVARAVTQRFDNLKQHVVDLLSVQAGKAHTTIEGASFTSAESSTLLTKDKVTINGKAIHLG